MEIIPVKYDIASVIHNLVNSISTRAKEKSLEFIVDVDESLPYMLFGDDVRITQVIMNLLTNAVKYTEEGSVTFSIRDGGRDANSIYLKVAVKDTGIGIKSEDLEKLFESFARLEEKRNRNIEGTGLGMSIVTKLLAMMESELKVDSVYGKGTEFSFELIYCKIFNVFSIHLSTSFSEASLAISNFVIPLHILMQLPDMNAPSSKKTVNSA